MDFTIFPPEFNSLNIQGSARPFLVAANAWKNLSNELSYAASRFESEINGLITSWRVNRPGMSGDSSSWKGWGHVRWFIEEVPAGAA
ncbi:PPE family protein [Mycobacterium tuberculosis]|nr:PPE family protein [Mycobacterium tuberculosis]CLT34295.1 PPE family protein [Mycobacterium tuberculosis]